MTFRILFSDYDYASVEIEEKVIRKSLPDVEFIHAQCKTEEDVIEVAKGVDAIINQYAPISRNVIEKLSNCKVVARYGVGVNTIDIDAAAEKNITVCNVTDYCLDEVSDHAITLLLSLARKVTLFNNQVKEGDWDFKAGSPIFRLRGRVLGLLSFGNIAKKVAMKGQAFGLKVIAYDPFIPKEVAKEYNVELVELDDLLRRSDFVSIHTPLTDDTHHIIGAEQLKLMKEEAFIVNTSRGALIDEKALIQALHNNEIAGAGLDVLEVEPIPVDNPLLEMDQVLINPHAAWHSVEAQEELKTKTAQNVADVLTGVEPKYIVYPGKK
ncbi:C-terminal binding protein [Oceanobacillus jeddahense]|uniref:C-terminal binding protein n=1 Tax=Oceanobacillus jeddahense TaxID=1462527 RepID=A0ABY5JV51_9BACI|nr:C-terminal binding protein [Oceanobacillus jeddahense]UUI04243.1 C-terminal binding protein [Oceanobacillus jeddahense]